MPISSGSPKRVARRSRAVYTITAEDRVILQAWLREPGAPPVCECEALVKLAYQAEGSKQAALAQVASWRATPKSGLLSDGVSLGRLGRQGDSAVPRRTRGAA